MSPEMFALMGKQEGFSPKVYTDSAGVLTIGKGTNLAKGITERQADVLAECEITDNMTDLQSLPWFMGLDPVRQDVVENMAYNLGVSGVREFVQMIAAFEKRDFVAAAAQMLDSDWHKQVGDRAILLSQIIVSGVFSNHITG